MSTNNIVLVQGRINPRVLRCINNPEQIMCLYFLWTKVDNGMLAERVFMRGNAINKFRPRSCITIDRSYDPLGNMVLRI